MARETRRGAILPACPCPLPGCVQVTDVCDPKDCPTPLHMKVEPYKVRAAQRSAKHRRGGAQPCEMGVTALQLTPGLQSLHADKVAMQSCPLPPYRCHMQSLDPVPPRASTCSRTTRLARGQRALCMPTLSSAGVRGAMVWGGMRAHRQPLWCRPLAACRLRLTRPSPPTTSRS